MLLYKHIELSADGKTLLHLFLFISQVGVEILRTRMVEKLYLEITGRSFAPSSTLKRPLHLTPSVKIATFITGSPFSTPMDT